MLEETLTRRRLLGLLAAGAGSLLAGCGAGGAGLPMVDNTGFRGARLSAVLRRSYIGEINELTVQQVAEWSRLVDASIDLRIVDDWREQVELTAQRRNGEDIAELFGTAAHRYEDRLVDLSELAEEVGELSGGWAEVARNAAMVNGVWRAVPWAYTAHAINVRPSLLQAVGVTGVETYDDLLDAAVRLNDAGLPRAGFSMSASAPNDSAALAYSMLWSFGGQEVDGEAQQVALDSAATRSALQYFRELVAVSDPTAATFDEAGNNAAFIAGDVAMTQNATSILWRARRDAPAIANDIAHAPYPRGPQGRTQLVEMNALSVFKHSRNIDAATDWIRWAVDADRLRERAQLSLGFFSPPMVGFADDPEMPFNTDPQLGDLLAVDDGGHMTGWPGPPNKEAGHVYENGSIVEMFRAVAIDGVDIGEAVRTTTEQLRRVYET